MSDPIVVKQIREVLAPRGPGGQEATRAGGGVPACLIVVKRPEPQGWAAWPRHCPLTPAAAVLLMCPFGLSSKELPCVPCP